MIVTLITLQQLKEAFSRHARSNPDYRKILRKSLADGKGKK